MSRIKNELKQVKIKNGSGQVKLKLGARTGKTMLCIYICGLISILIGGSPLFAMVASISCLQTKVSETLENAFLQILGTVIGGTFSVVVISVIGQWCPEMPLTVFYGVLAFMTWPIVIFTLAIGKSSITATSCVVFVAVCLSADAELNALSQTSERVIDTLIGIIVTVLVDFAIPYTPQATTADS